MMELLNTNMNVDSGAHQFTTQLSAKDKAANDIQIDSFNKTLVREGRQASSQLGKDDFLKLLITQLQNQDPTSPMEDTQFISQMAQFSSLEQMTNMSSSFEKMSNYITGSEAVSTLGKTVEIEVGDTTTKGVVEGASRGANPQVLVNGMYYSMDKIKAVYAN